MAEPLYPAQFLLKVTQEQKDLIAARATAANMSQQEYARKRLFGAGTLSTNEARVAAGMPPLTIATKKGLSAKELADDLYVRLRPHLPQPRRRLAMSQLFEYAVILNEKRDKEGEEVEPAEIIVPPTTVLARDEGQAQMLAARAIPEEHTQNGKMDRLVVICRPF